MTVDWPPYWVMVLCGIGVLSAYYLMPKVMIDFVLHSDVAKLTAVLTAAVSFGVIIGTAIQIWYELGDRSRQLQIQRDEVLDRARDRLASRAPGNTGKGYALSIIARESPEELDDLDLSCKSIGDWIEVEQLCNVAPVFSGLTLAGSPEKQLVLDAVNFKGSSFNKATISNTHFLAVNLTQASFRESSIVSSKIEAYIEGDSFAFADGAVLDTEMRIVPVALLFDTNISGSSIWHLQDITPANLGGLAFWADWPPSNGTGDEIALLDKMKICAPPEGVARLDRKKFRIDQDCVRITLSEAMRRFPYAYAEQR